MIAQFDMKFIKVRDALISMFAANQGTEWNTIGHSKRDQRAEDINLKRTIEVYYSGGDFQNFSSLSGPFQHDMKFTLMLTVAEPAKGDLAALEAATTEQEFAAASATFKSSDYQAERTMDDFISKIWLLVMDPQNRNLGLDITTNPRIGNRMIPNVKKEAVKRYGNFCSQRAMMTIGGLIPEDIAGVTPGAEMTTPEITGDYQTKDNVKQSGFLDAGTPVSNPLP